MDKNLDVLVISSHDRSFWLIDQLNRKGLKVGVWDLSRHFPLSLSERQGPLGKFIPKGLKDSQKQYFYGDQYTRLKTGFCILSPKGPLEFKGPLTSFLLKTRADMRYTHQCLKQKPQAWDFFQQKLSQFWILKLAAALQGGQSFYLNFLPPALKRKTPSDFLASKIKQWMPQRACFSPPLPPLFSEYIMGEASLKYFQEMHQLFQQKGVRYFSQIPITNLNHKQKRINLRAGSESLTYRFLVWTLSRQETKRVFPHLLSFLFPAWPVPDKIWRRTPMIWNQGVFKDLVPPALILTSMPHKDEVPPPPTPLAEEFYSLKKTSPTHSDLWMLRPYSEDQKSTSGSTSNEQVRKGLSDLPLFKQKALKLLKQSLPTMHFEIKTHTDFENEYFVLYKQTGRLRKTFPPGVFHLNPEGAGGFDNCSLLRQAEEILFRIFKERTIYA